MIDLMQQVIKVLVSDVLAPAVARTGDLDGVVTHIKSSVAHYARESGLPPDVLAMHFGKSERSIYRYYEQIDNEEKKEKEQKKAEAKESRRGEKTKREVKRGRKPAAVEELNHDGVQLMTRILDFFYNRKDAVEPEACVRYLRRHEPTLSAGRIKPLLDFYAMMGHLRKITEQEGGVHKVRFQAPEQGVLYEQDENDTEREQLLSRKLRALLPLVLAYLRRDDGASITLLQGRIMRKHLVVAMQDIRDYTIQRFNQAREDTERDDPDGREDSILACTLVMGGPGTLDDLEIERPEARPEPPVSKNTRQLSDKRADYRSGMDDLRGYFK